MWVIEYKKISWWYWAFSAFLLGTALVGWVAAYPAVIGLAIWQVFYFAYEDKSFLSFAVQLRVAYLLILLAGLWEPLRWVYWIPFLGTSVRVLTGYCLLARVMSLLPWVRQQPLSRELVRKTFLSLPRRGCILQGLG